MFLYIGIVLDRVIFGYWISMVVYLEFSLFSKSLIERLLVSSIYF